jgi:hypothetical protein
VEGMLLMRGGGVLAVMVRTSVRRPELAWECNRVASEAGGFGAFLPKGRSMAVVPWDLRRMWLGTTAAGRRRR